MLTNTLIKNSKTSVGFANSVLMAIASIKTHLEAILN